MKDQKYIDKLQIEYGFSAVPSSSYNWCLLWLNNNYLIDSYFSSYDAAERMRSNLLAKSSSQVGTILQAYDRNEVVIARSVAKEYF